jgi:hypothetical protein
MKVIQKCVMRTKLDIFVFNIKNTIGLISSL